MTTTFKRYFLTAAAPIILALLSGSAAQAQSAIYFAPSTDVMPQGKTFAGVDFISHLEKHGNGGFQLYVPRAIVGLGKSVEAGVNVFIYDAQTAKLPIEVQPNVKWRVYNNEKNGVAASVGGIGYFAAHNGQGFDNFGFLYSTASKKFKGHYGPRFTGGGYYLAGRKNGFGSKGGAILGYEQPLHKKVAYVMDWQSGDNRFGYTGTALAFTLPQNNYFYAGYLFGNYGRKRNALYLAYGVIF